MTFPGNEGMILAVAIAALSFRVTRGPDGTRQTLPSLPPSLPLGAFGLLTEGRSPGPSRKDFLVMCCMRATILQT